MPRMGGAAYVPTAEKCAEGRWACWPQLRKYLECHRTSGYLFLFLRLFTQFNCTQFNEGDQIYSNVFTPFLFSPALAKMPAEYISRSKRAQNDDLHVSKEKITHIHIIRTHKLTLKLTLTPTLTLTLTDTHILHRQQTYRKRQKS